MSPFSQLDGYQIGNLPSALACGDLLGRGLTDLVVGASDGLYMLFADAGNPGKFERPNAGQPWRKINIPDITSHLALGDFTGDGWLDLAFVSAGSLKILHGQRPPGLNTRQGQVFNTNQLQIEQYPIPTHGLSNATPVGLVAADLTGSGSLDLAVANSNSGTIEVYLNNGHGFELKTPSATVEMGRVVLGLIAADIGGNPLGLRDLIVTVGDNAHGGLQDWTRIAVLRNQGGGAFRSPTTYVGAMRKSPYQYPAPVIGRPRGAGSPLDVAVADLDESQVQLFKNDGVGDFTLWGAVSLSPPSIPMGIGKPQRVAFADLSRDGNDDLIVYLSDTFAASIAYWGSDGVTPYPPDPSGMIQVLLGNGAFGDIIVPDLNGDGVPDLAVATADPNISRVYVMIADPQPTSLIISPLTATVKMPDGTQQFSLEETFSYGPSTTNPVAAWTIEDLGTPAPKKVATITPNPNGTYQAKAGRAGQCKVKAAVHTPFGTLTAEAILTVEPKLTDIRPPARTVPKKVIDKDRQVRFVITGAAGGRLGYVGSDHKLHWDGPIGPDTYRQIKEIKRALEDFNEG